MATKKIGFIINPTSGTKRKENIPVLIQEIIDNNKFEPIIKYTESAGHGTKIAKNMAKEGFAIVVAVGGDGTVNEIAKGLINTNTVLGIIPCGSGNGLARHLQIPLEISAAIAMLNNCRITEIDYCTANDVVFFCTCGVGFDAHIGNEFAKSKSRGFFSYLNSIIGEFVRYKAKKYKFKTNEIKFSKRAFLVTFANASQYGNDAFIAPDADIQDGKIDVCILEPFAAYEAPDIGWKLMNKRITERRNVQILRTDEITIKRKKRDVFHYDGEPCIMKKKIKVKAHRRGLKVAVPEKSNLLN
jgi:YegS/Rv2252/BmrU family lipid kinase